MGRRARRCVERRPEAAGRCCEGLFSFLAAADAVATAVRVMMTASANVIRNDMSASFACNLPIQTPTAGDHSVTPHRAARYARLSLQIALGKIGTPPFLTGARIGLQLVRFSTTPQLRRG